ncbi:MAG: class I SAM-dependent methyltransferase [Dehalococcoidia bacterium]|nr:MAG: class I SAM-dependent methyltransferase [Dehalococcoidia bacterium]
MINTKIKPACRSCGHTGLLPVLSLGSMPLANALLTPEELDKPEEIFPLDVVFCPECSLVQITETVPPQKLFGEYLYFSSVSDTVVQNAAEITKRLISTRHLDNNSLVVEPASNDGYLLQFYQQKGIRVLGIEPAANIAKVAREEKGIPTLCEFFGEKLALQLRERGERADVIHGCNVLAHVADTNGFVQGIKILLKDNGVAVIEVPYVKDLIDHYEFDTIYHEHLCYFSLTAVDRLFRRHGLIVQDVERIPIHGGTLRLFVTHDTERPGSNVLNLLDEEEKAGMDRIEFYRSFGQRVETLKSSLRNTLFKLKKEGKRLAAYGAAAKGTVLLNYFGIGPDILDFVVDRSPYKQGRYVPGVRLPIYPIEKLQQDKPDYTLLLVWNIANEVLKQQVEYQREGGKFIVPIPEVEII